MLKSEPKTSLTVGSKVWWNDPDEGISSNYYIVTSVESDVDEILDDSIVHIRNEAGSEAEVFASELSLSPKSTIS